MMASQANLMNDAQPPGIVSVLEPDVRTRHFTRIGGQVLVLAARKGISVVPTTVKCVVVMASVATRRLKRSVTSRMYLLPFLVP